MMVEGKTQPKEGLASLIRPLFDLSGPDRTAADRLEELGYTFGPLIFEALRMTPETGAEERAKRELPASCTDPLVEWLNLR